MSAPKTHSEFSLWKRTNTHTYNDQRYTIGSNTIYEYRKVCISSALWLRVCFILSVVVFRLQMGDTISVSVYLFVGSFLLLVVLQFYSLRPANEKRHIFSAECAVYTTEIITRLFFIKFILGTVAICTRRSRIM